MSRVKPKPIAPEELMRTVIDPALRHLEERYGIPYSLAAAQMLVAIAGQETNYHWTRQVVSGGRAGPATGRWQFEKGGGVRGVLRHPRTAHIAKALLEERGIPCDETSAWQALEHDDMLAASFARLLLFTDPRPLPQKAAECWSYYMRNWRPGKPHPEHWGNVFDIASKVCKQHPLRTAELP